MISLLANLVKSSGLVRLELKSEDRQKRRYVASRQGPTGR
ncbi:hypothetical protein A2U01_0037835, partial [Trifolium medium]|nr:hypothetical protein [Trifolium medium]